MKQKEHLMPYKTMKKSFFSMISKPHNLAELNIKKIFNSSSTVSAGINLNTSALYHKRNKNDNQEKIIKSSSVTYMKPKQRNKTEIIKSQNELFDLQLKNSRLENEIRILSEKVNSLNEIIKMKETENDLLKTKYNDYINEFKGEISHLTKINNENKKYKFLYENLQNSFKNFIQISIEIFELFLSNKNHITHRSTISNKNDNSFDIYDSFTNLCDDERRNSLVNQIQSLFIAKLKFLDKSYSLNIDREIEKILNWNYNTNNNSSNNITNTISNISNILKNNFNNENSNSNSNENDFDLSMSKTFFHQSPRFSSFTINKEKNNISYGSFCDNVTNIIIPKSKSNNTSTMKNININITSNFNTNNTVRTQKNNNYVNMNILDCSFGDFVKKGDESFGGD